MALLDLLRARRGAALVVAALATLPAFAVDLPGDALHRLRSDRSLRTLTGLVERLSHGATDLVSASVPWRAARPSAALADWLSWQWFGLEAPLHRASLVALLALVSLGLVASSRDRDEVPSTLLGAAFVAHPVAIDLVATLRGREALFALAAGVATTRLLADASRARTVALAALGASLVGGAGPAFLPWFAALALTVSADRRGVAGGFALGLVAASPALLRWPASPLSALASTAWHASRVAVAPVALDAWASQSPPSWALSALAVAGWCALASLAWRRGARAEASSASLLFAGALIEAASRGAASGARVDAELIAVVFAFATLAAGLLRDARRGPHIALALAAVLATLGAARATAWRDPTALARSDLAAHPHDARVALSLAYENLRAGRRDAGCSAALTDPAVRAPALACVAVEAAAAGRIDDARSALDAYRATPGSGQRLAWDFGRALSLRPHEERARTRRLLGLPTGGAQ